MLGRILGNFQQYLKKDQGMIPKTRSSVSTHLAELKMSSLFAPQERDEVLRSVPVILRSMVNKGVKNFTIHDDHIAGFDESNTEIFRFNTPVSYKDSVKEFINRDSLLKQVINPNFDNSSYKVEIDPT